MTTIGSPPSTPSTNGARIIKIGAKGLLTFQLERDPPVGPFTIDVVHVYEQWRQIDRNFRDPEGQVAPLQQLEFSETAMRFFCEISQTSPVTLAEAMHFLKLLADEVTALQDFFVPASRSAPSSPGSTELTFST